jgi:N-(2-amino-2-carboxyethyl)-L-glutamate synthase
MELVLMEPADIAALTPAELYHYVQGIGNTPLRPIYFVIDGAIRAVHLKLEETNPTGSVKDRTGYALVQSLESQGILRQRSVIVESTSGNLGVALALLCRASEYDFIAVIDPKTTAENIAKMRALGAQIEMVEQPDSSGGYLLSRLERVQALLRQCENRVWTNQYANQANPFAHYSGTGPEIYRQMHGKVDVVFAPVSTGGTLAGIGRYFREVSPQTRIVAVDARGSVVFGTPPAPRRLTGIGSSRPSSFIEPHLYDAFMLVGDEAAFAFCRALLAATDIAAGGSSGAVLAACAQYLRGHPEANNVVCVCADSGKNYLSSIFNDRWLEQQGIALTQELLEPVQDILSTATRLW